jgi:hypothetical protein
MNTNGHELVCFAIGVSGLTARVAVAAPKQRKRCDPAGSQALACINVDFT